MAGKISNNKSKESLNEPFSVSFDYHFNVVFNLVFICIGLSIILVAAILSLMLLFVGGGVVILIGIVTMRRMKRYNKYISMLIDNNERSLDKLANSIPIDYATAKKEIEEMIRRRFIKGAYVDEDTRTIIIYGEEAFDTEASIIEANIKIGSPRSEASPRKTVVKCCGCGAKNVIESNDVGVCEYCKSPISAHSK